LFDMTCELWMQVLVIQTIWLLSLRFFYINALLAPFDFGISLLHPQGRTTDVS
jgi:hypothetical protein